MFICDIFDCSHSQQEKYYDYEICLFLSFFILIRQICLMTVEHPFFVNVYNTLNILFIIYIDFYIYSRYILSLFYLNISMVDCLLWYSCYGNTRSSSKYYSREKRSISKRQVENCIIDKSK
jgi:hypothetical protein